MTLRSQNATNIVAQKYFRVRRTSPARKRSLKQMLGRVAGTSADGRRAARSFGKQGDAFKAELTFIPQVCLTYVR